LDLVHLKYVSAERTGRNPQTGEEMTIPASKAPAFKPGKELKEAVK
jgi:DNA-binding protein HU-beta